MNPSALTKLHQKAVKDNIDLDNAVLGAIAKEVTELAALQEKAETAGRKMGIAIKRGDAPDVAGYTKVRDKTVDKGKSLQTSIKRYGALLKNKEKALKKADPKAFKLLSEVDKELDTVEDELSDIRNMPNGNEMVLGMLSGGYGIAKREDKAKETPLKRPASVDADKPGSGFLEELKWVEQKVPSLVLKSVLKHSDAIAALDTVTLWQTTHKADIKTLHQFLVKPSLPPEKELEGIADTLTRYAVDARKAAGNLTEISRSLGKLLHATPREKSAADSLTGSFKKVEVTVTKALAGMNALPMFKKASPIQFYRGAIVRAQKEAAAEKST